MALPELEKFVTYGIKATLVYFVIVFILHLLAAPYRLEKDKHNATKKLISGSFNNTNVEKPDQGKVLADILNRRASFSLREVALLLSERQISGELSNVASVQLQELQLMMRDGNLKRTGGQTIHEVMTEAKRMGALYIFQNNERPLPPPAARISRASFHSLTLELNSPINGLEP